MKILSFTDLHSNYKKLEKISGELESADLIILSGDITDFKGEREAAAIINYIKKYNSSILGVSGNCDYKGVEDYLKKEKISLHAQSCLIDGIYFSGCSYSLVTPFNTPSEVYENDYKKFTEKAYKEHKGEVSVFVVHQPPYDSGADTLKNGNPSGSRSIRECIKKKKPLVCFTGHIHESPGIYPFFDTLLVNPGPFFQGRYAEVHIENNEVTESKLVQI